MYLCNHDLLLLIVCTVNLWNHMNESSEVVRAPSPRLHDDGSLTMIGLYIYKAIFSTKDPYLAALG